MNEDETMDRLQRQFPPLFFCSPATGRRTLPLTVRGRFLHNWKRLLQNQGTFPLLVHILH